MAQIYFFNTGFFSESGLTIQKSHGDKNNKWDDSWDLDRLSDFIKGEGPMVDEYVGFVSNDNDVVTIHIAENSNVSVDNIKKWFNLYENYGVKDVKIETFKGWNK